MINFIFFMYYLFQRVRVNIKSIKGDEREEKNQAFSSDSYG
jgi:hypothetical protein